jgi:hypothetical protein
VAIAFAVSIHACNSRARYLESRDATDDPPLARADHLHNLVLQWLIIANSATASSGVRLRQMTARGHQLRQCSIEARAAKSLVASTAR